VLMASANVFAGMSGPGFPKTNAELSDLNPTYITPDGVTFSVWGVIYLLDLNLVLRVATGKMQVGKTCNLLSLAFFLNALWLLVFAREWYVTSLIVMTSYFLVLAAAYSEGNATSPGFNSLCSAAVSTNLAWVSVATCLNFFITAARFGAAAGPLPQPAGTPSVAIVIAVAITSVAVRVVSTKGDWPFAATCAWALFGIFRAQDPPVSQASMVCAIICSVAAVAASLSKRATQ